VSPPAEGSATGPPGGTGLASAPSLGSDGAESRPHGGHRSLRRRNRLRPPLVLRGQILDTEEPPPADFIAKLRQSGPPPPSHPLSYPQMAAKPPAALLSASFVYVRKGGTVPPLSPLYSGLYNVLASGPKVFRLQVGEREESVSTDCLKPHWGAAPVQPAQPPARGWLPAG
jgi:hypothetical protein